MNRELLICFIIIFFAGYYTGKAIMFDEIIKEDIKENENSQS